MGGAGAGDERRGEHVRAQRQERLLLAARDADPRGRVHDRLRPRARERRVGHAGLGEVARAPLERVNLVRSLPVTQLLHERAPDEAGGSRDQDSHRGRVYCRVCLLLGALLATLALAGCHGSKQQPGPPPPAPPKLSFRALDAQQQRLVADYEPVSRALTGYELAYRDRQGLAAETSTLRGIVARALGRLRGEHTTGGTERARLLLVAGLEARSRALGEPAATAAYLRAWNRSVVDARRALTLLQDIRDRERLIPLPEDSIS